MQTHLHDYFPQGAGESLKISPRLAMDVEREAFVGEGRKRRIRFLGRASFGRVLN